MPSQSDVQQIDQGGKVSKKRRFDTRDWSVIAEFVIDEFNARKRKRKDREKHWDEIDRQVRMEPDTEFKYIIKDGRRVVDINKMWMSEMEMPLQAQALEVLTSDARRMMFADRWFSAHAEVTDEYLAKIDFSSIILGDEAEVPSQINQDNADKLVEGFLQHLFRQVDFETRQDRINAEAFKYGMGVGRARLETKSVYIHESRGVRKEKQQIPVLVPVSIRNLYLDEPMPSMHSSQVLGQAHIACDWIKLTNLHLAANRGSKDPDDLDGGWMPQNVRDLEPNDNGFVQILEYEGDLVVPRKTVRSVVIPGAIVTVAVGGKDVGGDVTKAVIRFRFRKTPYSSYLLYPYHYEGVDCAYPTSPLEKGRPVQMLATEALNNFLDSAALKKAPPVGWDKNDASLSQQGGPRIHPNAQWETTDLVKVYDKVGGDPTAMSAALSMAINLYAELTGVMPARLGAQTVSHTTAFAKDAELQRGATRTVDFVNTSGQGALTRWLYVAYDMARETMKRRETASFYIKSYGGFVEVTKEQLPERATFEWLGAGGPAEEAQKNQQKLQALQMAVQMDQLNVQLGKPPKLNLPDAIDHVLRAGGWTDLDVITQADTELPPDPSNPGASVVAQQQLPILAGQAA